MSKNIVLSNGDNIIANEIKRIIENQYGYACTCLAISNSDRNKQWRYSRNIIKSAIKKLDFIQNRQVADHYNTMLQKIQYVFSDIEYKCRAENERVVYLPLFRKIFDHNGNKILPNKNNERKQIIQGFYRINKKDAHWKLVYCDTLYDMMYCNEYVCKNGAVIFEYNQSLTIYGSAKVENAELNQELSFSDNTLSNCPFSIYSLEFLSKKYDLDNKLFVKAFLEEN